MHSLAKPASACFLASVCLVAAASARADEVWMKNGDRLTGTVVRKADDTLILRTGYAGEIRLQWSQVERISTDRPVDVLLTDDAYLKARLAAAGQSRAGTQEHGPDAAAGTGLRVVRAISTG